MHTASDRTQGKWEGLEKKEQWKGQGREEGQEGEWVGKSMGEGWDGERKVCSRESLLYKTSSSFQSMH